LNFGRLISILRSRLKKCADVAELVDAQVSEACCREAVEVRFFSSAPHRKEKGRRIKERALSFLIVRDKVIAEITANQGAFGLDLADTTIARLTDFYEIVQEHNPLLHLVAPCTPVEFSIRHILESLTLLKHLPENCRFADVGSGAGLPSIPCLIARPDLFAFLIESKEKKARFLEIAVSRLGLTRRAIVINKQFQEVVGIDIGSVACRALDRFTEKLPRLLKWTDDRKFLFFGGPTLERALRRANIAFERELMPMSSQRYLFVDR
jgi:16S rRNA (guanine527-N7)-methyltransferase